jgi:hypothetical protein
MQMQFYDIFVYHESEDEFSYHEQRINRTAKTDALWNTIKDKLTKFYMEDMAPEIADPVFSGSNRCRQPTYRLEAESLKDSKSKPNKNSSTHNPQAHLS